MMKSKKIIAFILAVIMCVSVFAVNASALVLAETQYRYDQADPSWLKDLVVMEQLNINDAVAGQLNKICPVAEYEYSETAQTFKDKVSYYTLLYKLDENSQKAAYLYVLDYIGLFSSAAGSNVSDEYIRYYLEECGIVYPENQTSLTPMFARALYSLLTSTDSKYTFEKGTGLETALMAYAADAFGIDLDVLRRYNQTQIGTFEEYVTAACKYTLYLKGYSISKDADANEVARMMAVYVIESQGIAINPDTVTFPELQNKYLTAMLGTVYGVTPDPEMMKQAVGNDTVAAYLLQLIGKKYNLTVRNNLSYEERFNLVRDNTDFFKLENNQFYADIDRYSVNLDYKRDHVWVMPSAITNTNLATGCVVEVYINGAKVKDAYFSKVNLDSSKASETVTVRVDYYKSGETKKTTTYSIDIYQGTQEPPKQSNAISDAISGSSDRANQIIDSLGKDSIFSDIFSNISFDLPQRVMSIMSLLVPSFTNGIGNGYQYIRKLFGFADDSTTGEIKTDQISGVGGLEGFIQSGSTGVSMPISTTLVTNNQGNTSGQVNYVGVAQYTVEPSTGNINYTNSQSKFKFGSENTVLAVSLFILAGAIIAIGIAFAVKFKGSDGRSGHSSGGRRHRTTRR